MAQVSRSFDQFWSDKRSAQVTGLMGPADPKVAQRFASQLRRYACDPNNFRTSTRKRISQVPLVFQQLAATNELHWVDDVVFVSDDPGKNPGKEGLGGGGLATTTLIEIVRAAKKRIVIQTPYLITTSLGEKLFQETTKRGVQVIIMTNSLPTTDGLAAHRGYQRVRSKLLAAGVELYEFRPDARIRRDLMSSAQVRSMRKLPIYSLHAKTMVVDDELLVIGTFNLDPRSANLNTECVVLIPSAAAARGVLDWIEQEIKPENSLRVTEKDNGDRFAPWTLRFRTWLAGFVPAAIL
ncbi:MAG: Cardiolipin synthetase [Myxococcales bacterium]|nr:Cardiolipin synthetase [Myxococcales bacterium]